MILISILAFASLAAAGTACDAVCATGSCGAKPVAERQACFTDCATKAAACWQEKAADVQAMVQKDLDAARAKFEADRNATSDRIADWKTRLDGWRAGTSEDVKTGCNQFCMNKMAQLGDKFATCTSMCSNVTDAQSAVKGIVGFVSETFRAKLDELKEKFPEQVANIEAATAALRDAVGIQRAFLGDAKAQVAAALDAKKADIAAAREARDKARTVAKDAIADCKARLTAETTDDGKAAIRAECKASVQKMIDEAKAAFDAAKSAWTANKAALIDKIKAFLAQRKDNRRVIVADLKNVVGTVQELRDAVKAASPEAEVDATAGTKKRAGGATVVATCEKSDNECYMQLNSAMAGAVTSAADVTVTETTADELTYSAPANEFDASVTTAANGATTAANGATTAANGATTAANGATTTAAAGKTKDNGAASLALSAAALVVVAVAAL